MNTPSKRAAMKTNQQRLAAAQVAHDNASPTEPDYAREQAEEVIDELLRGGDKETAELFADYAYETMHSHNEIINSMAALFSVSDSKWRTIVAGLDDVLGEPLNALRLAMNERRAVFIANEVDKQVQDDYP